jgi:hypothetical protein
MAAPQPPLSSRTPRLFFVVPLTSHLLLSTSSHPGLPTPATGSGRHHLPSSVHVLHRTSWGHGGATPSLDHDQSSSTTTQLEAWMPRLGRGARDLVMEAQIGPSPYLPHLLASTIWQQAASRPPSQSTRGHRWNQPRLQTSSLHDLATSSLSPAIPIDARTPLESTPTPDAATGPSGWTHAPPARASLG